MKKVFLILMLLQSSILSAQELDCKKFRNGKFKIESEQFGDSLIERKGSKQIEYGQDGKVKVQFKVKWIDDCTYTLQIKKVIENKDNIPFDKNMILTVEIIEVNEHSYRQRSTSNLYDFEVESEVLKIE